LLTQLLHLLSIEADDVSEEDLADVK